MKKEPLSPGAKRGGKALSPRPAALPLPQPRRWLGTRAVARCWGPSRRRGASDNAGSVCAGICVLRPPGMQGLEEPLCCHHCRHKGCPSLAALPVTQLGSALLPRARGEGKFSLQQHCPDRTRLLRDCPAASPQISSPGASPPGSALTCHVDVGSGAASPHGNDGVNTHPAYPAVGTGWHLRGRQQEVGMGSVTPGTSGAQFTGIQAKFWVQKRLSPTG